jgi:hypothetical protein
MSSISLGCSAEGHKDFPLHAVVRYVDVGARAEESFEDLLLRKVGDAPCEWFGSARNQDGGRLQSALVSFTLKAGAAQEWREVLHLGLPPRCIEKMQFLGVPGGVYHDLNLEELYVAGFGGALFGKGRSSRGRPTIEICRVHDS